MILTFQRRLKLAFKLQLKGSYCIYSLSNFLVAKQISLHCNIKSTSMTVLNLLMFGARHSFCRVTYKSFNVLFCFHESTLETHHLNYSKYSLTNFFFARSTSCSTYAKLLIVITLQSIPTLVYKHIKYKSTTHHK